MSFLKFDENRRCPITRCIWEGNADVLKRMLRKRKKNPTPLQANRTGWTALHIAAIKDEHADCLKLLLSNKDTLGLNLDAETDLGETAFFLACERGSLRNCRILLDSKCNPEIRNGRGETPLHIASTMGHANIVSELIAHGWDPNCLATVEKITPLHCASGWGNLDVVRVLMASKRTKANIRSRDGRLPLHYACLEGFVEIVRILVEADSGLIDGRCDQADTPLIDAVSEGHVECVKYLLDQGASANKCTIDHKTTLRYAFERRSKEITELVLQASCPIYIREESTLEIREFLSNGKGDLDSLMSSALVTSPLEYLLLLLKSDIAKCVLESPYLRHWKNSSCYVYSPIAYLFYLVISNNCTEDEVDKFLSLLLQHKITHLSEFREMVELKSVHTEIFVYEHPFTYIFKAPWSSVQRDRYLSMLFEHGITTDYSLQCDVHYDSRFRDFDAKVLIRFYKPVVKAIKKDNAEFIELLLIHSAILEPSHLWNFLQYQHEGRVTMENESPQNVVNYLVDLGVVVGASNLALYPSGGTIKCPNLQQLCRQTIRKHLRDVTMQDNLKNFKQKINALPLPNLLKDYLNFKGR